MKGLFARVLMLVFTFSTLLPVNTYAQGEEIVMAKLKNRGFKEVKNLGVAASSVSLKTAIMAKENGKDVGYTTADGGIFNVVDIKENKLLYSAQLGEVTQVWSQSLAPDGTVYMAGLADKNAGELWSYNPQTQQVQKIGSPSGSDQLWSSTVDEKGNVYVGTYPTGKIIKYDVETKTFIDFGQVDSENEYVRALAYHDGYIYAGLGVVGKAYKINVETQEKENITANAPDIIGKANADIKFVYDMAVIGDYLFAKFDSGAEDALLFYDLKEQKWLDKKLAKPHNDSENDYGVFSFQQLPVQDNKVYVILERHIQMLDLNTFEVTNTGILFGSSFRGASFVDFEGSETPSLVTFTRGGETRIFNLGTKEVKTNPCVMLATPLPLHNLGKGPDGKLYMTTYPGGPKGAQYDPKTNQFASYNHGQAEGLVAGKGNDLYFGMYPGAVIQKMDTETLKLTTLFNLKDTYEQDRPYIMQFAEDKLLIGTIPDYGKLGGTLTIYDTQTEKRETHRNIIEGQSIVGIAYKDGKIYGSTSIRGGLDTTPTAEKAKIFVWNVAEQKKEQEFELDFPELDKPPMISGLMFDKDGVLWGAVDGILFAMNPNTLEVVKRKNIYPTIKNRGMWRPVHIIQGKDGLLYTDIAGTITVVDPETLDHVSLVNEKLTSDEVDFMSLAEDNQGNENIYFTKNGGTVLQMIPVIEGGIVEEPPAGPEVDVISIPVPNGSFEEPVVDGKISGWSSLFEEITSNVSFEVSKEHSKTGEHSLKVVDQSQDETVFAQSDLIPVVAGIEYTGSVEMFLEDGSASFFLRYYGEDGKQVGGDKDGVNIIHVRSGHKEWQTVKAIVMAPEGARYARLFAGTSKYFTTSGAYYDDFKLTYEKIIEPEPEEPGVIEVPIINAELEKTVIDGKIPGWSSLFEEITSNVSFEVSKERSKTGEYSLKVVDQSQNETIFAQSDPIPVVAGIEYTGSVEMFLEDGSASFFLRYYGEDGKQVGGDKDGVNIIHVRSGYKEWKTVKAVVTAPEGAKYARLFVGASNYFTTSGAYYDDFKLTYEGEIPEGVSPGTLLLSAPSNVEEEKEFTVALAYFASESKDLYAFDAVLDYDSSKVELISISKAGEFNKSDVVLDSTVEEGNIRAIGTQTGDQVVSQNGEILLFTFKAVDLGETTITLKGNSKVAKPTSGDTEAEYPIYMDRAYKIQIVEKAPTLEDVNRDGKVNLIDLVAVAKKVGKEVNDTNGRFDVNKDGVIDLKDVEQVIAVILNKK